jgi:hypothetical protein
MPDVDHLDQMNRRRSLADLLTADLGFEYEDVELFRMVISHCAKVGDCTTLTCVKIGGYPPWFQDFHLQPFPAAQYAAGFNMVSIKACEAVCPPST